MQNSMQEKIQSNLQSPSNGQKKLNTRPSSQVYRSSNGTRQRTSGKSKYAQKSRGKSQKPVAAKPSGPVFTYTSVCCSAPATKKPCVAVSKKDALMQGLGKFRCSACKKRASVTVSKFKTADVIVEVPILAEVPNA